jgi:hypothetical protein
MLQPALEFLCEIRCELAPPLEFGSTYSGFRRVVDIQGGVFSGPALRGAVRGGSDWQVTRNDGVIELQAHYVLVTDDGVPIQVRNRGLRHGPEEALRRIAAGENVDTREYYCRTTPVFDAPSGKYDWLNRSVFVATAQRFATSICLHVYRVG